MKRKPGVDIPDEWRGVLAHRDPAEAGAAAGRFVASGLTPAQVRDTLADGGDGLYAAARTEEPGWAEPFGGQLGVALLAAEVSAFAAHLSSRAARVRAVAVNQLLDDLSAVTVADRLGVSRQKVYDLARNDQAAPYIDTVPWRQP
ncbi:hypothetical protein ACQP2P_22405 [Dactylosporangium sp. CA-139114]|uniref:hypothetical protein n=1 Tax=Dactylosporangium sp. CA-139114 TaxID=3239931 RepID=UPI003D98D8B4